MSFFGFLFLVMPPPDTSYMFAPNINTQPDINIMYELKRCLYYITQYQNSIRESRTASQYCCLAGSGRRCIMYHHHPGTTLSDYISSARSSRKLVLVIVAIALLLDNMLLTTVGKTVRNTVHSNQGYDPSAYSTRVPIPAKTQTGHT